MARSEKKKSTTASKDSKPGKKAEKFQAPRGMKDILPHEQHYWSHIKNSAKKLFDGYNFEQIDTPVVESAGLFQRSVGLGTDIVEKEMYVFKDRGDRELALRPEGTAGIVRAYIEHGMKNLPKPLKLYSIVSLFRYDRPQAGRTRQHHQIDAEVIGDPLPIIDAQLIQLAWKIYEEIGLTDIVMHVNSLGDNECRPDYMDQLKEYLQTNKAKLCPDCRRRTKDNPLRVLDCKEEKCIRVANNAPQLIDNLCDDCHEHFKLVLEYLDELELPNIIDPKLVRGQDYYTKTVFEFYAPAPAEDNDADDSNMLAIGGGGRYDNLVELLGDTPTPAAGFGIGIERTILAMQQHEVKAPKQEEYDLYLVQLGELARKKSLNVFEELRIAGYRVAESFSKGSIKSQLKKANKSGAPLTLILGQKEALDETIMIRDMGSGVQEAVPVEKMRKEIKKRMPDAIEALKRRKEKEEKAKKEAEEQGE